jgi:hypothetical protein
MVVMLILTFGQVKAESKESIYKCHACRKECRAVCNCILIGFFKKKMNFLFKIIFFFMFLNRFQY